MKAQVATGIAVSSLVQKVVRDTISSLHNLIVEQHNFIFNNRAIVAQPIDIVRWISEHVPVSQDTLHIRNVLVNSVAAAESRQPGSGYIALLTALELLSCGSSAVLDKKIENISQATRDLLEKSKRASVSEAFEVMMSYDKEPSTHNLAKGAIENCSSNAALSVEIGSTKTHIKKINGHIFPCHIPETFLAATRFVGRRPVSAPRVIVIDGMVERMSEIENIIGGSHASREPLILFARGYAPDVQNTLGRNYVTGHLLAIPLVVPYDELGANMLGDISIVCGADPISSFKGDLISSREWKDLKAIESAIIETSCVSISNSKARDAIKRQRKHLGEKRKSCVQIESEILDRRLQCLMGQGIVVEIGHDAGNLVGLYKDRIGTHIRLFRSIGRHGIIRIQDAQSILKFKQYQQLADRFNSIPAASLTVGVRSGIACAKSLQRLGGVIYSAA